MTVQVLCRVNFDNSRPRSIVSDMVCASKWKLFPTMPLLVKTRFRWDPITNQAAPLSALGQKRLDRRATCDVSIILNLCLYAVLFILVHFVHVLVLHRLHSSMGTSSDLLFRLHLTRVHSSCVSSVTEADADGRLPLGAMFSEALGLRPSPSAIPCFPSLWTLLIYRFLLI